MQQVYRRLYAAYGPQHWWPGDTPFEVVVGAILTQAAAWTNVEKAIGRLKAEGALSPRPIRQMSLDRLAELVRASGYFNAKARKLKAFCQHLGDRYGDALDALFASRQVGTPTLREELLSLYGIGEETADSIVLYAAGKPAFVIDAYTRRILGRLGLRPESESYGAYQALFTAHLPADAALYNEYHALLVRHGKETCVKRATRCGSCCLADLCLYARQRRA